MTNLLSGASALAFPRSSGSRSTTESRTPRARVVHRNGARNVAFLFSEDAINTTSASAYSVAIRNGFATRLQDAKALPNA